jgi:hypothetical protein
MTYFPNFNCIIVFGGRQNARSESGYRCFNDLYFLHIEELTWTTVSPFGTVPEARCGHAAAAMGTKLVVFGGIHNSHFCSSRLYVAEIDPVLTRNLIIEKERHDELLSKVNVFKIKRRLQSKSKLSRTQSHISAGTSPTHSPQKSGFSLLYMSIHTITSKLIG